jgi:hypothetical protein
MTNKKILSVIGTPSKRTALKVAISRPTVTVQATVTCRGETPDTPCEKLSPCVQNKKVLLWKEIRLKMWRRKVTCKIKKKPLYNHMSVVNIYRKSIDFYAKISWNAPKRHLRPDKKSGSQFV